MRRFPILVLCVAAFPVAPVHAREVLRLQPSTPWVLDYAEENCRLGRNFGEGDQRVTLVMDQFKPGDDFRVTFTGKPVRMSNSAGPVKARLRFGPQEPEAEITAQTGTTETREPVLLVDGSQRLAPLTEQEKAEQKAAKRDGRPFEPTPIGQAREAAATWLALTKGPRRDLVFETGPMAKPLAALRECSWDTVKSWGLDVEQQKTLTRKAVPKHGAQTWFHAGDYPMSMIRGGYEGIVNFRLLLDPAGKPTDCQIQMSTRPKQFDDAVCRAVMKRAQFEPALDSNGRPAPSYWIATVHFRLCC